MQYCKILIVCQETTLQHELRSDFESRGYSVQSCDANSALTQATNLRPEMIIVDGSLPGTQSLEVCQSFKHSSIVANSWVILLTEALNPGQMKAAYQAGIDFNILKQGKDRRALRLSVQTIFNLQEQANIKLTNCAVPLCSVN